MPSLQHLPYDLVLNIVQHLNFHDINRLKLTCKHLHYLVVTRPVYRHLAVELLRRCRALPLTGFQRLSDLSTAQLIRLVNKAQLLEHGWLTRTPQPALSAYFGPDRDGTPTSTTASSDGTMSTIPDDYIMTSQNNGWYKIVSTPPHEKVDWLSPITASFTLCATKGGRVILWDILRDCALAEWHAGERWELWKCRVEFERRTVYFTMARHLGGSRDDHEMEFKIMQIQFPKSAQNGVNAHLNVPPTFSHIRTFMTSGIVMNIFLLDPTMRLLSGFVLMWNSTTIGLFVLLDWDKDEYVFIDTMIQCGNEDNWSCIFHNDEIIIHSEGANGAAQYFYPLSLLREHISKSRGLEDTAPRLNKMLSPPRAKSRRFTFPRLPPTHYGSPFRSAASYAPVPIVLAPLPIISNSSSSQQITQVIMTPTILANLPPNILQGNNMHPPGALESFTVPRRPGDQNIEMPNPFKYPDWYPESAHFVRQWWPTLPAIPRLSCTVILFAVHDPLTHRTKYVLSQHYFRVPIGGAGEDDEPEDAGGIALSTYAAPQDPADALMRMWYVSLPFEIVCVLDEVDDEFEPPGTHRVERPRPLLAVDFGHAVWIQHMDDGEDGEDGAAAPDDAPKRLRFVSFPPVYLENEDRVTYGDIRRTLHVDEQGNKYPMEGDVKTMEIPPELDLDDVETINIDQSQGAVILSVKGGKIFILCYE